MHMARWMVRPHMANAGISWDSCIAVIPGQRSVYLLDDPQYIMDNVPAKPHSFSLSPSLPPSLPPSLEKRKFCKEAPGEPAPSAGPSDGPLRGIDTRAQPSKKA